MERNVGNVERAVRVTAGVGLLSLVFVGPQTVWGLVGINTCGVKAPGKPE